RLTRDDAARSVLTRGDRHVGQIPAVGATGSTMARVHAGLGLTAVRWVVVTVVESLGASQDFARSTRTVDLSNAGKRATIDVAGAAVRHRLVQVDAGVATGFQRLRTGAPPWLAMPFPLASDPATPAVGVAV